MEKDREIRVSQVEELLQLLAQMKKHANIIHISIKALMANLENLVHVPLERVIIG